MIFAVGYVLYFNYLEGIANYIEAKKQLEGNNSSSSSSVKLPDFEQCVKSIRFPPLRKHHPITKHKLNEQNILKMSFIEILEHICEKNSFAIVNNAVKQLVRRKIAVMIQNLGETLIRAFVSKILFDCVNQLPMIQNEMTPVIDADYIILKLNESCKS